MGILWGYLEGALRFPRVAPGVPKVTGFKILKNYMSRYNRVRVFTATPAGSLKVSSKLPTVPSLKTIGLAEASKVYTMHLKLAS